MNVGNNENESVCMYVTPLIEYMFYSCIFFAADPADPQTYAQDSPGGGLKSPLFASADQRLY